jgi:membrane protease YdiL (CAAX protease family)
VTEDTSIVSVLVQCAVFIAVGALLVPLVRVLRVRHKARAVSNPRASAFWALGALAVGWVLVMAFFFVARSGAPAETGSSQTVSPATPEDVVAQLLVCIIAFGPALVVIRRRREPLASAGVSRDNLGRSLVVSIPLVAMPVAWRLVAPRLGAATPPFDAADFWALMKFVIVGFGEEFAYRGYLQTRLVDWLGQSPGWILASVLMAMAHVGHRVVVLGMTGTEALASSAALIPISLFLGFVMLRTRSIVAPGILHTAINWLNL